MSWGTCYSGSNNIHFKDPALMSDSRLFTQFGSTCKANNSLKKDLGLNSNYDYRQYLINNGLNIMGSNFNSVKECSTKSCHNPNTYYNNKYLFKSCDDQTQPYGYETSDLKKLYLSRNQLQSQLSGPILSQEQLLIKKSTGK